MLRRSLMLVIGASLASACGPAGEAREPDQVAAQYQGPIQSSDVARGEELYNGMCMACHGGAAPALEGIGWEPGAMRQIVREGRGRMPAIGESRLSADELEALLAYMVTIGGVVDEGASAGGAEPVEPDYEEPPEPMEGDLDEGY